MRQTVSREIDRGEVERGSEREREREREGERERFMYTQWVENLMESISVLITVYQHSIRPVIISLEDSQENKTKIYRK